MFPQISVGTFSAYLTLQALYCIIIIAGIAINCAIEVSTQRLCYICWYIRHPEGRENSKLFFCSFCLIWVSASKKGVLHKDTKESAIKAICFKLSHVGWKVCQQPFMRGPLWKTIKAPANSSNHLVFAAAAASLRSDLLLLLKKPLFFFEYRMSAVRCRCQKNCLPSLDILFF